jgi:hypothetical protein
MLPLRGFFGSNDHTCRPLAGSSEATRPERVQM